jgi:hypothetical protein
VDGRRRDGAVVLLVEDHPILTSRAEVNRCANRTDGNKLDTRKQRTAEPTGRKSGEFRVVVPGRLYGCFRSPQPRRAGCSSPHHPWTIRTSTAP